MPDHAHLLIEGTRDTSRLEPLLREYKQRSSFAYKEAHGAPLWQRGYYDHVIRAEGDLHAAIKYILENPVRKGLVEDFRNFPFSGPPETLGALQ